MQLTTEQQRSFAANGFLVVRGAFADAELARFLEATGCRQEFAPEPSGR